MQVVIKMNGMSEQLKKQIIFDAQEFFRNEIVVNHKANTAKLAQLSAFKVNPFLVRYISQFTFGKSDAVSIAKSLIYPRALGTSITTTFGTKMQQFCNRVLRKSLPSTTSGMDIEYIDADDGKRKFCQVKAGPDCINRNDIETIENHFRSARNLARTNGLNIPFDDFVVGVLYGDFQSLNQFYKTIANDGFTVLAGKEFWYHLTGDNQFFEELIFAFGEVALEVDCSGLLEETIQKLAREISEQCTY